MTARTRVEAADAVVSVQAEGVDQATKKIKEVDKALGALPAAAKSADAAAADSAKRWQELAGKVGAAVGAFASVQAMDLSTSSGLMGLAGVAATATAALGPLGLAVTAGAAGVNLLVEAFEDSGPASDLFMGQMDDVARAVQAAASRVDELAKATGGYLSTLSQREKNQLAEAQAAVKQYTDAAKQAQLDLDAGWTREKETRLESIEAEKRWAEITVERLTKVSAARAKERGLAKDDDNGAAAKDAAGEREAAAAAYRKSLEVELDSAFEAARRQREQDEIADRADQLARARRAMDAARAAEDERRQVADQKRGIRELQGALADFYQWKAEQRQRDLDTAMAVNSAALNAAVNVAGAFGASEATMNKIKGLSSAADAILYGAKAYAAAGSLNPWSAVQYGLAAVAAGAASVAYFQAAGEGGGGGTAPAVPSGGGAGAVSAPPENRGGEGGGSTTINVSFDRAQRPLTRGDERAIHAGVVRALSGPGGARGLGSRRVAS